MAMGKDRPSSFRDAMQRASQILARNPHLVSQGLVDVEAEQIVLAAFRRATGQKISRAELFMRMRDPFPPQAGDQVVEWSTLRADGRILQYLIGYQSFLNHEYEVSPAVLVPRPETELLVRVILEELKEEFKKVGRTPRFGLEVGVGSGVISIELLDAFPDFRILSSEVDPQAQQIALRNAERILGKQKAAESLEVVLAQESSQVLEPFFDRIQGRRADFLVSNPPYLVKIKNESHETDQDVFEHEPHLALFAPQSDSLYFYREIAEKSALLLTEEALIFLEIPHERADAIQELFQKAEWNSRLVRDLNQRERILIANRANRKKG